MTRQKNGKRKTVQYCKIYGCSRRVVASEFCQHHLPRILLEAKPHWMYENEKGEAELAAKYGRN
jgi:hypothetical protein